jgi:lipopolysaccharide export LptBFGC system permease protein LptF
LALFVFMQDALQAAGGGETALRELLPVRFNWPLFLPALALMAAPMISLIRSLRKSP